MKRMIMKERTAGGGEGENRYKLSIKQINLLFISFGGVGPSVQRISIYIRFS
jgi:hypothetical protein